MLSLYNYDKKTKFFSCSSSLSNTVRSVVGRKWLKHMKKYHVDLPYECPINPQRDIYKIKEDAKTKYKTEQTVCLADYCDIMRCDAEKHQVPECENMEKLITDVEIWTETSTLKQKNQIHLR
uniref:CSON012706 protein n=1 Tax=Culicoides sonorensis TaxID=179676 RepID=A0A336KPR3_CULSO